MTTATKNDWMPYTLGQYLSPGDEVKFSVHARKNQGKIGIFERMLQKNISVVIEGVIWRMPPSLIESFRRGDSSNLPMSKKQGKIQCNSAGLLDCKKGDVVLMWRGKFDVVRILSLTTTRVQCLALDGRRAGKEYGYKPEMFVQKLDNDCFNVD